ncbi:MAG TPA: tRNA isopentenyl-2-thiomethyl-A-37 hydroxylase MiaE [Polyangiaceae bacterium]|nr:tRNA isopentenyl-2-thiomethyl-A-37 hydroxylase MiaE [Polyangiaceae bacterium]
MLCLKVATDAAWVVQAMRAPDAVLVDHAHCEIKAAANALSLAARYPDDAETTRTLAALAAEEIDHFQKVHALLSSRGVPMGRPPVDPYAAELRRAATRLPPNGGGLVDRLLVGALIEARSCERFQLLADATRESAAYAAVHDLWTELFASEARHYRTFVDLAVRAAGGDRSRTTDRLEALSLEEGIIVSALARGGKAAARAAIHG